MDVLFIIATITLLSEIERKLALKIFQPKFSNYFDKLSGQVYDHWKLDMPRWLGHFQHKPDNGNGKESFGYIGWCPIKKKGHVEEDIDGVTKNKFEKSTIYLKIWIMIIHNG